MSIAEKHAKAIHKPEFDEAAHVYSLNGRRLPSVTQIIDALIPRTFRPGEWYMGRGSAIHKAIQLHLSRALDMEAWRTALENSIGEAATAVVVRKTQAAIKFIDESSIGFNTTELRLASVAYQFAGTIDAIGMHGNDQIIIDWKSSIDKRVELQLGGYAALWIEKSAASCAVELRDDGTYRSHFYKPRQTRLFAQEFLALRSVYGSLESRNLLRKEVNNGH